uniref:(northern house mosquito) hypothetical protein n=1 Tax=Culex pipiens TaxID=7175 RepID=A0A8D8FXT3_CULPI
MGKNTQNIFLKAFFEVVIFFTIKSPLFHAILCSFIDFKQKLLEVQTSMNSRLAFLAVVRLRLSFFRVTMTWVVVFLRFNFFLVVNVKLASMVDERSKSMGAVGSNPS